MQEVKHNAGPTLMIAIPTLGRPVPLDWALNFKSMNPPINFNCDFSIIYGKEIAEARNALAQAAIDRGCKYLFFLGDDVVAPPHTLRQLIYRMENMPNVDIVGGVYCAKCEPPAPLVFVENGAGSYWDWKIGEFFPCTGLGMDCTLIRTEIFSKIEKPWFKTVSDEGFLDAKAKVEEWTEDLYFLDKARQVGAGIYCDGSIICEHHDVYAKRAYKLPSDSLPMRLKGVTRDKRCLMLGPKLELADQSFDITRCTQNGDRTADYRVQYGNLPFDGEQFDFVCVTEHILDIFGHVAEWNRVLKPGGKITINLHPHLNPESIMKIWDAKMDGSFIEMVKCQPKP